MFLHTQSLDTPSELVQRRFQVIVLLPPDRRLHERTPEIALQGGIRGPDLGHLAMKRQEVSAHCKVGYERDGGEDRREYRDVRPWGKRRDRVLNEIWLPISLLARGPLGAVPSIHRQIRARVSRERRAGRV